MKLEYILKIIIMFVPFKKKKNITCVGIINIETTDILDRSFKPPIYWISMNIFLTKLYIWPINFHKLAI
jgi:hypothetical protein